MLNDRIVAIVGGSTGIGRATAIACGAAGATVIVGARKVAQAQAVADEAGAAGAPATLALGVDVRTAASVDAFIAEGVTAFGRIDGAVNNAGVEGRMSAVHDASDDDYADIMDVNARGLFFAMRAEIQAMAAGGHGAIVNVGSVGSFTGLVGQGIYAASKHAVWALTRSAAVENAGRGIRINMIAPAGTETPMLDRVLQGNADAYHAAAAMHPIGRFGQPAESAAAIVWLLSDAASFVCGQSIGVDGGYSATLGFNPQAAVAG
ncbi:NAD(P)-dependent dehydrogenase (short-subunit alcohol dehydrogenase family) [Sphingopyxis panaciterrae]|uniref:SDR family NAD(P)-dependent oxidoreductase n=1 Tax=Sphingopyxis panaciterrae TaxID=363841 RepID=UPI0014233BBD|nr:SDR family oxidoreductase [Sphingopyxis panaciterrae]NIJ36114.1 NAD(P)-dependent dehydrogenase (short-subunit alcohol dehydrogenase family) [Sphingopyxis panaciterrae]